MEIFVWSISVSYTHLHFKTHGPAGEKLAGKILRRLKFDNVTIRNTCRLIRYHDLRPTPDAEDVRRAVNLIGEELFPLYLKVQKADLLSQSTYRLSLIHILHR